MRIFYDVDTQNDFMNKDGALYVPNAELIKPNLRKLTEYAEKNIIPILGSVDKLFGTEEYKTRELELKRWGGPFPDYCMNMTIGQLKIHETGIWWWDKTGSEDRHTYIPHHLEGKINRIGEQEIIHNNVKSIQEMFYKIPSLANAGTPHAFPILYHHGGLYIEKQSYNVFTNPLAEKILEQAGVKEAVVYGVGIESIRAAVIGMQARRIQCYVVEDAIMGISPETTKSALEKMVKAGAKLVKTKNVLEGEIR